MYYRLNKNTFFRAIDKHGYLYSQLTKHDLVTDEAGCVFLSALSRNAQSFESLLEKVLKAFIDPPVEQVEHDLRKLLDKLVKFNYLTSGATPEECDHNEAQFSYAAENAKTSTDIFLKDWEATACSEDSVQFFAKTHRKTPRVHACQIEINNLCNERCIHCYIPHQFKSKRLSKEQLFDVLEQLHEMGTLSLTLSGGEPLLHPDFIAVLHKARELDFSINVLTNLTKMDDAILAAFKECNVSMVQTSLYSMVPEEHDHITKLPGSQVKTKAAIERLVAAEVPVQISCPCMRTNYRSYKDVLRWAAELNCKAQTDYIMMARTDFSTDNLDERLTLEETGQLIRDIMDEDVTYKGMLEEYKPSNPEEIKDDFVCGVAIDNICLAADGTYYPCSGWQGLPVGTIQQRLKDVWENSPQLQMLRKIRKSSFPACLKCADRDFCNACLVRNFNESGGDMFKVSKHFCQIAHLNRVCYEEHCAKLGIPVKKA